MRLESTFGDEDYCGCEMFAYRIAALGSIIILTTDCHDESLSDTIKYIYRLSNSSVSNAEENYLAIWKDTIIICIDNIRKPTPTAIQYTD